MKPTSCSEKVCLSTVGVGEEGHEAVQVDLDFVCKEIL